MKVSFVFDVISPFAYLAFKRLGELPAGITLEYVPVLFGAILNHHGQLGPAEIPSKRRFTYRFALWRAAQAGVPMRMPPAHPFNPLGALRLLIAAGSDARAAGTLLDAVFMQGRDVSDAKILGEIARELGVPDLEAALASAEVKQRLRENTEWALARGVFGVPTFVIGDELFWGQDAFEMVLDYLRDPAPFESAEMRRIETLPVAVTRTRKPG